VDACTGKASGKAAVHQTQNVPSLGGKWGSPGEVFVLRQPPASEHSWIGIGIQLLTSS